MKASILAMFLGTVTFFAIWLIAGYVIPPSLMFGAGAIALIFALIVGTLVDGLIDE